MTFASPAYFLLLLLLVPIVIWHFLGRRLGDPVLTISTAEPFHEKPQTWRRNLLHMPFLLRVGSFILIVIVLARPQTSTSITERDSEGIDIVMALDISTSMLTPDLKPNRIEAAKQVAFQFINNRPNDNIGLTLFGGEAFTQCPLTTDHAALLNTFKNASCDLQAKGIISPGTAIGMGIANAVAHLENSKARSKVVILVTDGVNNAGEISPLMAAEMAEQNHIRVYTIAIGQQDGKTRQAVATLPNGETYSANVENAIDTEVLRTIAQTTGGIFYQAASNSSLREIYDDIDKLEKTKLKVARYDERYEAFQPFAIAAFALLILELLLRLLVLRRVP